MVSWGKMQLLQVLRDEQPSPICRDILKAAGGHSCQAHLIQSPVGAQRQQIIVLSLQNLTCLMAKKKTKHSDSHKDSYFKRDGNKVS